LFVVIILPKKGLILHIYIIYHGVLVTKHTLWTQRAIASLRDAAGTLLPMADRLWQSKFISPSLWVKRSLRCCLTRKAHALTFSRSPSTKQIYHLRFEHKSAIASDKTNLSPTLWTQRAIANHKANLIAKPISVKG